MPSKIKFAAALLCIAGAAVSQSLPDEMHFSTDGHRLQLGNLPNTGLYDQSLIRNIYLTFPQSNYWQLMQTNYNTQTDIPATMVVDGVTYDSVGVRFKGQTSYSQTQTSQKKSFNITTDFVDPNQKLMGYQTLNLNNCFQDESFLREVFFQHQLKNHIPVAKSAFVNLYINGANWGLYPNVQQLNKDFLEEWFLSNDGTNWRADKPPGSPGGPGMWGDGTAALNYLGNDTTDYKAYYTLKSTDKTQPWDDLVHTCDVLENTPLANLPAALPVVLDIDRTLWFLASEVLFSDDDSYIYKGKMDYYVYYEPETGRITPQEYDGNSVMDPAHQTWSPFYNETNANYPLMNRLFAIPEYRQRYIAHLRTLINELFDITSSNTLIDNYKNQVDVLVQNDPKKLYTYTQFNSEITVLKNFISARRNYLLSNTEVAQPTPSISNTAYYTNGVSWTPPAALQDATVRTNATFTTGVYQINLFYSNELTGNFTKVQMFDDGAHDDGAAADGTFGATLPGQAAGSWVRFYVEAVANNTAKSVSYDPVGAEHDVYVYIVAPAVSSDTSVVINEIMASNSSTAMDNAGENDDWIELYNKSANATDISNYYLTDNSTNTSKWKFPNGTVIPGNGYLIVWADEDSSQNTATDYHCSFKLSASGEQLMLLDGSELLVDSMSWGTQVTDLGFARVPNGYGNFVIQQPTFSANNDPLSVAEVPSKTNTFIVFPNPAKNTVKIVSDNSAEKPLTISNAVGQVTFSSILMGKLEINLTDWASGLYFVKYGEVNKKLVVVH